MNKKTLFKTKEKGAALLLFVVFFLFTSLTLVLAIGGGVYDDLSRYQVLKLGKMSYYAAAGGIEDAVYRHKAAQNYSASETFVLGDVDVTVTRVSGLESYTFTAEGDARGAIRRDEAVIAIGDGASFNFGLQSGNGGIRVNNNSSIIGNVYSNGTIEGSGNALIRGDVISAGPSGMVRSIHATGSAWAHSIENAVIDQNAYYYNAGTITGTIVGGSSFPDSPDQATSSLPITDEKVEEWKDNIESTGTEIASSSPECLSGTYVIDSDTSLGNVKINCNVEMRKSGGSANIILTAPIWISGNLSFSQGPTIIASSSLGTRSVQLIVDDESNRTTSSKITVNQSTTFQSGNASSYVLLLSMNNSSENGGTEKAIDLAQSANGQVLAYAGHGYVDMGNSITLREVTAHQIEVSNGAQVIYDSGLISLLFTSGPGGGFTVTSWKEIE